MAAKSAIFFCACSLLVNSISAQCIGNGLVADEIALAGGYPGLAANAYAYGAAPFGCGGVAPGFVAPTSGGGFTVTSSSPIAPTGISVVSENAIEGALSVVGELPFLGAVAMEGALPSGGAGGINYGCGTGAVGIVSEGLAPAYGPAIAPAPIAPGRFGPVTGPGYGYNGPAAGCGYGPVY